MISEGQQRFIKEAREGIRGAKERIKRLHVLDAGSSGTFWKSLKGEFEQSIKNLERVRDSNLIQFDKREERDLKARLTAANIILYKGIIFDVEGAAEKSVKINNDIRETNVKIQKILTEEKSPKPRRTREVV